MATEAQINANRKNAELSHGPVSTEGKARSAANATKHGLSAPLTVLPHEDRDDFQDILDGYVAEFEPDGYHETFLVQQMALARMRLSRVQRLELCFLEQVVMNDSNDESGTEHDADIEILAAMRDRGSDILSCLQRYAAAAERSYHKAYREFVAHRRNLPVLMKQQAAAKDAAMEQMIHAYINAPLPTMKPLPLAPQATPKSPVQNEPNLGSIAALNEKLAAEFPPITKRTQFSGVPA